MAVSSFKFGKRLKLTLASGGQFGGGQDYGGALSLARLFCGRC